MNRSTSPEPGATPECLHGVFLTLHLNDPSSVVGGGKHSLGTLITGKAGIGKSELALDLISRGHALVADDAPCFRIDHEGVLYGSCPAPLNDFLEVRGLGILNIRRLFGPSALRDSHPLDLIIHLTDAPYEPAAAEQRLTGTWTTRSLAGRNIPALNLSAQNGRNLALLVETAARQHLLSASGYNAANDLSNRLAHQLGKESQ